MRARVPSGVLLDMVWAAGLGLDLQSWHASWAGPSPHVGLNAVFLVKAHCTLSGGQETCVNVMGGGSGSARQSNSCALQGFVAVVGSGVLSTLSSPS